MAQKKPEKKVSSYIVWIDCEMTGLNAEVDRILEIAVVITDNALNIVHEGPSFVIYQPDSVLSTMNRWCIEQHGKSGLTKAVGQSNNSEEFAQQEILTAIKKFCKKWEAPLAGNTIYQDRIFLKKYMPELEAYLHYRVIDVSSIKECIRRWYPEGTATEFKKSENHRALEDVKASIEELRYYRNTFFVAAPDAV